MDMVLETLDVVTNFATSVVDFLPHLAAATILLVIGWIIGVVVGKVTREILTRVKVDEYISRGKKPLFKLSNIFAVIFTWSVYLVFIQAALSEEVLGIPVLAAIVGDILSFVPGLIKAIVVILVGYALAEYVRREVDRSKVEYSNIISKVLFWLLVYVAIAMALPLVGIDATLVNSILLVIVGSVGIGLAIAIGWGLKDTIATLAKSYQKKAARKR